MTDIHGEVAPGFEGVKEAFARNMDSDDEVGASVAIYHKGDKVVDLWGGLADEASGRLWEQDTVALVFSTTKGMTAAAAHILAERGELDFEAPVTEYWPEFGTQGKEDVPVKWLFCHKTGLVDIDDTMTLEDALAWDPVVEALAAQKPLWEPGTQHGYHAVTFGWLAGEIIRRVSGKSLGTFFADEVAAPLDLDTWIGLPAEIEPRVSDVIPMELPGLDDPAMAMMAEQLLGSESVLGRALFAPGGAFAGDPDILGDMSTWNDPRVRAAEIGAASGVTTARSLSKMYAALVGEVDGVRLIGPEQVKAAHTQQTSGLDQVLMNMDIQFGLGYMLPSSMMVLGGPNSFGHFGAGGSAGFADPDVELGFGYVMNKMFLGLAGDPRSTSMIEATYQAIA
jgi:CubicO group peptidase (beta-lactamase class C family)